MTGNRQRATPNPHMLSIARDLRGLTRKALSEQSGIPARRLRLAESCDHFLTAEPGVVLTEAELERLATALQVPVSLFFRSGERYRLPSWTSVCKRCGGVS